MMSHAPRPSDEQHHSRTVLTRADAVVYLADRQLDRLEALLPEVRNTERFLSERRRRDRGRDPERRHS